MKLFLKMHYMALVVFILFLWAALAVAEEAAPSLPSKTTEIAIVGLAVLWVVREFISYLKAKDSITTSSPKGSAWVPCALHPQMSDSIDRCGDRLEKKMNAEDYYREHLKLEAELKGWMKSIDDKLSAHIEHHNN